jgi:hypothetical protein
MRVKYGLDASKRLRQRSPAGAKLGATAICLRLKAATGQAGVRLTTGIWTLKSLSSTEN